MAIVRVRKDVTLLSEKGKMAVLSPRKADTCHRYSSVVKFKHFNSGFESQKDFDPNLRANITSIAF